MIIEIQENGYIKKIWEDGSISIIPTDPLNSDYQAYLASLNETSVK
jgi:hypothetical protein